MNSYVYHIMYEGEAVNSIVTNGSKTAAVHVAGFLCVSLCSSTIQLHNSLRSRCACICTCSEAGFSSQNGDHAWGVCYWRAAFCVLFCWQKDSMQGTFIKKCFLFMVESVCHLKRFTAGSRNYLKDIWEPQMIPDQVALSRLQRKQLYSGWNSLFELTRG
jgi:hypothetical protein